MEDLVEATWKRGLYRVQERDVDSATNFRPAAVTRIKVSSHLALHDQKCSGRNLVEEATGIPSATNFVLPRELGRDIDQHAACEL